MISVEDNDTARAEKLQRELTSTVDGVLQTSEAKVSVLTQTLTQDAGLEQQARENNISTGKAALVNRVLAINPSAGTKFDPHQHQAISVVPSEQEANTVVTVLQKGYLIADRVLRPALVTVSAPK